MKRFRWPGRAALLLWAAGGVVCGAQETALTDVLDRPALPIATRIEVREDANASVQVRVTLVFPHSGFDVADWGTPVRADNRIGVDLAIECEPLALPVITERSQVYELGPLAAGDYVFEATSAGHVLGIERFTVAGTPRPPAGADLRVRVLDDRRATARVRVVWHRPGCRVGDWGYAAHDGDNQFTIRAQAGQPADAAAVPGIVWEEQHSYWLARGPLPPGAYTVRFLLNDHPLAETAFTVHEDHGRVQRVDGEPLTEPGHATHPIQIHYWHPSGIDTATLGNGNIRITGPDGYARFATLDRWAPAKDGAPGGVVATYLAHAPGSTWTAQDNGAYGVSLVADSVHARSGYAFPAWRLGIMEVAIPGFPPPWIRFHSVEILEDEGPVGMSEYSARLTLIVGASNIDVRWGEAVREGNRFQVDVEAYHDAPVGLDVLTERVHTYPLGPLAPGPYVLSVSAYGRPIGEHRFAVDPRHSAPPRAEVFADDITEPRPAAHAFQIRYKHDMDLESIRGARIRVAGPLGYGREAELVGLHTAGPVGQPATAYASYRVAPPPHGWVPLWNGFYGIYLPHDTIRDVHGNHVAGGLAGGFHVMIEPVPEPGKPQLGFRVEVDPDGIATARLEFLPGATQWRVMSWSERVHLVGHTYAAKGEIHEYAMPPYPPQQKSYRLGRLDPGLYRFAWLASNGFASHHLFRIGEGAEPAAPYRRWLAAATALAAELGEAPPGTMGGDPLRAYAFALDALGPAHISAIVRTALETDADGVARLLLTHPVVPTASDVAYRVELSADLAEWRDGTGVAEVRELRQDPDGVFRRTLELPGTVLGEWPANGRSDADGTSAPCIFVRILAQEN